MCVRKHFTVDLSRCTVARLAEVNLAPIPGLEIRLQQLCGLSSLSPRGAPETSPGWDMSFHEFLYALNSVG